MEVYCTTVSEAGVLLGRLASMLIALGKQLLEEALNQKKWEPPTQ